MNRAQRRKQARELTSRANIEQQNRIIADLRRQQKLFSEQGEAELERLKNTTSEELIEKAYKKGYGEGMSDAAEPIIERYYCATMMALNELFGFGQKRCLQTLHKIEECLIAQFNDRELANEVEKKLGIQIVLDEGIDRAQPMDKTISTGKEIKK